LAQDDYYYEIQLTNKQLVFYFMAGAAGLILSFLAGVMVGRGVEGGAANASDARSVAEEKIVAEQSPAPPAATPTPTDFSYPGRLESDRPSEGLEKARPGGASTPAPTPRATPVPTPRATATPARPTPAPTLPPVPTPTPPTPAPATPRPAGATSALPKALASSATGFAIQVGAFKDRDGADTVVKSLKGRGFPAYTVPPAGGGLFTVRVGVYRDRVDAETVQDRLSADKFKPFIVKQ
jgi:cell division septation protein DedD